MVEARERQLAEAAEAANESMALAESQLAARAREVNELGARVKKAEERASSAAAACEKAEVEMAELGGRLQHKEEVIQ
jgi:hypothetical protein